MIYLILSILSSTTIFIIFKYLDHFHISVLPVIIYNYLFAAIPGFFLSGEKLSIAAIFNSDWLLLAGLIGILFIVMFNVVGLSSAIAGISVTSVASKMSVAIPISFSIFYDPSDRFTIFKLIGTCIALSAIFLIIYKKKGMRLNRSVVYLPVLLFLGMGMIDSLVKYAQFKYISDQEIAFFSSFLFTISFLTGIIFMILKRGSFKSLMNIRVLIWGTVLGVVNFGSIFFLIKALNFKLPGGEGFDSSTVFAINNTGIVLLSVMTGLFLFKEKLNIFNRIGILMAIVAIVVFAFA